MFLLNWLNRQPKQLPSEVWVIIFSYLEPFQSSDKSSLVKYYFNISSDPTELFKKWIRSRCVYSVFNDGIKYGVSILDLSCLFPKALFSKLLKINTAVNKGAFFKYPNFERIELTDELILENDKGLQWEFERQDAICKHLMLNIHQGFSNLKVLILDGLHKLTAGSLTKIINNYPNIEKISLIGCWNVKKFDTSQFPKLKFVSIDASQILLRLSISRSIKNSIKEGREAPQLEVKGGTIIQLSFHDNVHSYPIDLLSTTDELLEMCRLEVDPNITRLFVDRSRPLRYGDVIARYELYENVKITAI